MKILNLRVDMPYTYLIVWFTLHYPMSHLYIVIIHVYVCSALNNKPRRKNIWPWFIESLGIINITKSFIISLSSQVTSMEKWSWKWRHRRPFHYIAFGGSLMYVWTFNLSSVQKVSNGAIHVQTLCISIWAWLFYVDNSKFIYDMKRICLKGQGIGIILWWDALMPNSFT